MESGQDSSLVLVLVAQSALGQPELEQLALALELGLEPELALGPVLERPERLVRPVLVQDYLQAILLENLG